MHCVVASALVLAVVCSGCLSGLTQQESTPISQTRSPTAERLVWQEEAEKSGFLQDASYNRPYPCESVGNGELQVSDQAASGSQRLRLIVGCYTWTLSWRSIDDLRFFVRLAPDGPTNQVMFQVRLNNQTHVLEGSVAVEVASDCWAEIPTKVVKMLPPPVGGRLDAAQFSIQPVSASSASTILVDAYGAGKAMPASAPACQRLETPIAGSGGVNSTTSASSFTNSSSASASSSSSVASGSQTSGPGSLSPGFVTTKNATLPDGRDFTSAVWDGANAYIFGGPQQGPTKQILRYNPATDTLTTMSASLPSARWGTSAIWDGSHAYVFGGYGNGYSKQILRFDPFADVLITMNASLPKGMTQASVVWDGSDAYIFGGYVHGGALDTIVRYNPATDTITTMAARLPEKRWSTSAVWDGSNAYIFGGRHDSMTDGIVRYTPATDHVVTLSLKLPAAKVGASAVWDGSNAYIFGGTNVNKHDGVQVSGSHTVSEILRYNPASNTVTKMDVYLPAATQSTSAVWAGNGAYVFGGRNGATPSNRIVEFAP